jgi:hypothetical protein
VVNIEVGAAEFEPLDLRVMKIFCENEGVDL